MRRFILTYQREGHTFDIEGVLFSDGGIALEFVPDGEWPGPQGFLNLQSMEYQLNEFADTSIKWLDEVPGYLGIVEQGK